MIAVLTSLLVRGLGVRISAGAALAVAVFAAGVAGAWWLSAQIDGRARAEAALNRAEELLAAERAARIARDGAIEELSAALSRMEDRAALSALLREEVLDAPSDADGPLLPVLADALKRLRERQ